MNNPKDTDCIISLLEETKKSLIIHCKKVDKELCNIEKLINRYKGMTH